ncbi:hypothetical protein K435DRAFT_863797 [Dendrothele bispora CBS 962.96]|uniref:DUF6589 domain-containing protein n=1 Tax=Dendrothele bispora (strain CBS 962.96) TaxID=1314807 RepID=A0A4S8LNR5_DENBC|nr:hypothetical protein K435DRAFT_863797 [Dendrothele bispora CBS 962.96]
MDTPCSTPAQNADVIENLVMKQGGIGNPHDPGLADKAKPLCAIDNHVVILYGDLSRKTPSRRFNNVVYSFSLFHVKMAAADAVWRTFIEPSKSRNESDVFSLMVDVKILRPRETVKISTKPGFRQMHEVILHDRISLNDFTTRKPSWALLRDVAAKIAVKYVTRLDFPKVWRKPVEKQDQINENMLF